MVFNRVVNLLVWVLLGHWRIVGLLLLLGCPVCGLKCIPLVHVVGFLPSGHTPLHIVFVYMFL